MSPNLDTPMYPPYLASRLAGLSVGRVNRWLRGYEYSYKHRGEVYYGAKESLVERPHAHDSIYASFLDLIDLIFIKRFIDRGFTVQKMRKALFEVKELSTSHHFAQSMFWTNGAKIYVELGEASSSKESAILELLSGGQWVIAPTIVEYADKIDFSQDSGFAERWFPIGRNKNVVIDPDINFGSPTIAGRGMETANIYDTYLAEKKSFKRVARWMDVTVEEVSNAVEFEECIKQAA